MKGSLARVATRVSALTVLTSASFVTPNVMLAQPSPQPGIIRAAGDKTRALDGLISITRAGHSVPKEAQALFQRAVEQEKKNRIEDALTSLLGATQMDPLYWDAHVHESDLYWKKGQKQLALEELNAALAIDPNSEILLTNKAVALLDLGDPEAAEQAATSALRLEPDSGYAHYLIGLAQMRQGAVTSETLEHVSKAVGTVPQASELLTRLQANSVNSRGATR